MAFPVRKPYAMRVEKVINGSGDVTGATLKFEIVGGAHKEIIGAGTNSNGSYDLGNVGDWSDSQQIKVTATKGTETGSKVWTIAEATDHGKHDFGTITIAAAGAATGLRITSTHTPSSSSDTGTMGQIANDENYQYYCYATNSWKRIAWQVF
jgi:hypothetical protein